MLRAEHDLHNALTDLDTIDHHNAEANYELVREWFTNGGGRLTHS
jgi:hypothetical protein